MATVELSKQAQRDFAGLPMVIQRRVRQVFARLVDWPNVSGAKPLSGALAGQYRIRTGDWRVRFTVAGNVVTVIHIRLRTKNTYDD
jgi:mRNA-degrading endonuclease RelE of RelBE toxin-antitoxin system